MYAISGIWSAQVPAIVTDEHGLRLEHPVLIIFSSSRPHQVDVLLMRSPSLPEHAWRLKYNLLYGPFEEITLHAQKEQLTITIRTGPLQLFLKTLKALRQIGAATVPATWDEHLNRLLEAS